MAKAKKKQKRSGKRIVMDLIVTLIVLALLGTAAYLLYQEFFPNNVPVLKLQTQTDDSFSWDKLRAINSDTIGWLRIDDTTIDTPVVQTTDNDKYLKTAFDGSSDERGTPFLDKDYHWTEPKSQNSVIYGHSVFNASSGIKVMFDDLHNYVTDPNYYSSHATIEYDRPPELGGNGKWQIFAVIEVEATVDYRQPDFADEESFVAYYQKLQEASLIKTDVQVNPGDEILTLSTCTEESIFQDGRLAVIAKRVS